MIGRLKGLLLVKKPSDLLIDVGGIGYEVRVSMNTFYQLPDEGREVILNTHLVVREDNQTLYGFYDVRERLLFRELIKISGIGPRIALAILSGMETHEFTVHVSGRNADALSRIPGIGKKTSQRLIMEMYDRLNQKTFEAFSASSSADCCSVRHSPADDAAEALIALGYKRQDVQRLITPLAGKELTSEEIIRQALKNMVK